MNDEPRQPQSIHLEIDQLVLHGFPRADRQQIGNALQSALTDLLRQRGLPERLTRGSTISRIEAGSIEASPMARPAQIGQQIATQIYNSLGP